VIVLPTATLSVAGVTFTEPTGPLGAVLELHAASAMPAQARAADQRTAVVREDRFMAATETRVQACTRIFACAGGSARFSLQGTRRRAQPLALSRDARR